MVLRAIDDFLFAPASPLPLAVLRIGVCIVLVLQAICVAPCFFDLFGGMGYIQHGALPEMGQSFITIPQYVRWMAAIGIGESAAIIGLGIAYLASLSALLLGWHTHFAAVVTWFTHLIFVQDQIASYGVDYFAHVALFLLLWMPSGAVLSLDAWLGRGSPAPSGTARLSLRVLQIYLCIAYLATGLEKSMGSQWWNGDAIWRALLLPSLRQIDMSWIGFHSWVAKCLGWGTLLVETGYAIFIWPRRTRYLWVGMAIGLHVGIAVFLGLWLFSLMMIVLNISAFLVPLPHRFLGSTLAARVSQTSTSATLTSL